MGHLKTSLSPAKVFLAGDHTHIQELIHPKNDGLDLPYSLAHGTLPAGHSSLPHILKDGAEVYVFLKGIGILYIDNEAVPVKEGDVVLVPENARQHLENTGDQLMEFFCIVSPPWDIHKEVIC